MVSVASPRLSGDVMLEENGADPDAAIEELLCKVGAGCPEVAICSEGESYGPDVYEWHLELTRFEEQPGDLGIAVYAALSRTQVHRDTTEFQRHIGSRRCTRSRSSRAMCRPLRF